MAPAEQLSRILDRIVEAQEVIILAHTELGLPLEDLIAAAARKIAAERVIDARQMELPGTAPEVGERGGAE
jgi:hypothetical protein